MSFERWPVNRRAKNTLVLPPPLYAVWLSFLFVCIYDRIHLHW